MDGSPVHGKAAMPSISPADPPPRRPSLLPAFEPFSSSPALPRPTKRKFDDLASDRPYYPTPVPTSSTAILPSSPPAPSTRPGLHRTVSTLSERAPLGDVPTLDLPANGEPLLMGRSSNSSDYQLSANRHISRVHVRATYLAPDEQQLRGRVEIECLGWNGCRLHCRGEIIELTKGKCWTTERFGSPIIVDVQDTRVMLVWPKDQLGDPVSVGSRSSWPVESPTKRRSVGRDVLPSSPPIMTANRPQSPVSPTPAANLASTFSSTFRAAPGMNTQVQVYVDHSSDEDAPHDNEIVVPASQTPTRRSLSEHHGGLLNQSFTSAVSENEELSEHDEENDPIVHSFGPFGENILSRLQSFTSSSPERKRKTSLAASPERSRKLLKSSFNSPDHNNLAPKSNLSPVKNHVINQLAFSRVHSLPLSTIHSNLPAELRAAAGESSQDLKPILDSIPCVGEISREGKDAAGKLLESEFYYVPEQDTDEMRRDAVTQSLGKTTIRAARKQHKQYYWKRPRH